ncbi:putative Beta-galactosidase [Verrucomicrobia bacterium]|nr:putative Beta-galactosidase [Verrucomicrobiota bacterium]
MNRHNFNLLEIWTALGLCAAQTLAASPTHRHVLSLDGTWQIAEGRLDQAPAAFDHTVAVPGLVSLAQPPFFEPGPKVADRRRIAQKDPRRDAFWYRRTFRLDGPVPPVATLKVNKAMFGTHVVLNGQSLGDHLPCFTPGYFDAAKVLQIGENELLVRVGADRDAVTEAVPSGFDFEKERYIPGIFDSVELILCGSPSIVSVQTAPDIRSKTVRVQARLRNAGGSDASFTMRFTVREAKSAKIAGRVELSSSSIAAGTEKVVEAVIPIDHCRLWSPETPFLYTVEADSGADACVTRFGMRVFRLDPVSGRAVLNGRPYFMRGSNFTLYRFFEDGECRELPWKEHWVRRLHQRVKDMHWNCLRYCIGFPPEAWYRIADEEGILIQDEFPIWFGGKSWSTWPKALKSPELAAEYAEWMQERWNHPSVVIWDASNETTTGETGAAIRQVRPLDLSGRPWDNSYSYPQEPGDSLEAHPYHFIRPDYKLALLAKADPVPSGNEAGNDGKHAAIINEYGWLWLNRDGTPTTLTEQLYKNLLGPQSTMAPRRHLYATYLAAETEFWRTGRRAAAVMHFTTLGYSRPEGQTSDHWINVPKLEWEPEFYRYVRDSFAPVGLSIGFWEDKAVGGQALPLHVTLINDLDQPWNGPVTLRLKQGNHVLLKLQQSTHLDGLGKSELAFDLAWPGLAGCCTLEAELHGVDGKAVRSTRELEIISSTPQTAR